MQSEPLLSRNNLVELTGMSHDILTFWLRYELLRPVPGRVGRGRGLRFQYLEANIAAVMLELRSLGVTIEAMNSIAGIYRDAIAWAARVGLTFDDAMAAIRLLHGPIHQEAQRLRTTGAIDRDAFDCEVDALRPGVDGRFPLTDRVIDIVQKGRDLTEFRYQALAYVEIAARPVGNEPPWPVYFWRTEAGWKRGGGQEGQHLAVADGSHAQIAIAVTRVLAGIWNPPDDPDQPTSSPEVGSLAE